MTIQKPYFCFNWVLKAFCLTLLISSCLISPVAYADTELENDNLARVVRVLESLNDLIMAAEIQQDPRDRVQFNYDALRNDIRTIKTGIEQKFGMNQTEPRVISPIEGDYVNLRSKNQ